jgi:cytochrome bd-type quinol oxidase subunit 2
MMNTVAPIWDGNETWLVLGGEGLLAAFPVAYSIILSGLYLPLIFMLVGLIFRGVAFEFRFKANERERPVWDLAFIGGSVVAAFFQGVSLGAFLHGIPVSGRSYAGGPFDWLAPFPLAAGFGVVIAYALLGATWLIMKTEGELQKRMVRLARPCLLLLAAIGVVSLWTPLAYPRSPSAGSASRTSLFLCRCRCWWRCDRRPAAAFPQARAVPGPSSPRWRWCCSATPAWRSASGRTSSPSTITIWEAPRRPAASASPWSARCSSCR